MLDKKTCRKADVLLAAVRVDSDGPQDMRNNLRSLQNLFHDHEMEQCSACRSDHLDCPGRISLVCRKEDREAPPIVPVVRREAVPSWVAVKLASFLFDLLRDHVTAGVVEKLVRDCEPEPRYEGPGAKEQAELAAYYARRLLGAPSTKKGTGR